MNNSTAIEFEIEKLETKRRDVEYEITDAKDNTERRELYEQWIAIDKEINKLINFA